MEAALSDPDSAGIVVCGAAGVGKSRVAREALEVAEANGCEVRWAIGTTAARALPLGAFSAWTGSTFTDSAQLVHLVRGVIDALTAGPSGAPVVVGVDDVHLLDELSTFVVQQIVQRRAARVVLTVRDGEPIPVATQELWKDGRIHRLDIQPLSREESIALVSTTLGGPLDPDTAERLWRLTRGNVLYLRNIVDQDVVDGRLALQRGRWRWISDPVVPPGLAELIEVRIGALRTAISDVVDALAVGEPIELGMLTRITDSDAVEEADMRGLITLDSVDGRMEARVAHPLYGEVRRRRAAPTRLRRLRGLVASELAMSDDCDDMRTVVRRAELTLESDLRPDPDLLTIAAQGAVSLADMPLADRLAQVAIKAGGAAHFIRAWALAWLNPEEADAVLTRTPTSDFTEAEHFRLGAQMTMNRLWGLADPEGTKTLIDNMSRNASVRTRGWVDGLYVIYWASMANPEAATKAAENVSFEQLPVIASGAVGWALTVAHGDAGRTAEARVVADAGYAAVARTHDAPHMVFLIGDKHVGALWQSGQVDEACSVAEKLRQQATDLPGIPQLLSASISGRAALGAGRLLEACSHLEMVVDRFFAGGDVNGFGYRFQIPLAIALAMRGMTDGAAAALTHLEQHRFQSCQFVEYERELTHAWVAACRGAMSEAIGTALTAAQTARANGQFAAEVIGLQTATQFGDASGAPRLQELQAIVEGPRVGVTARFAAALRSGNCPELAEVSEEFERMGDLVAAVDAAAHAAIMYRKQGRNGSALGCSTRAEALAVQCGGASTPALRAAIEPLPLTDREREIVMLLGEGLSNKEIGERLTLSVRTVESHIYRAMAKTGTTSREDLAALLPRRPRYLE